jgi:hypothetical protein
VQQVVCGVWVCVGVCVCVRVEEIKCGVCIRRLCVVWECKRASERREKNVE